MFSGQQPRRLPWGASAGMVDGAGIQLSPGCAWSLYWIIDSITKFFCLQNQAPQQKSAAILSSPSALSFQRCRLQPTRRLLRFLSPHLTPKQLSSGLSLMSRQWGYFGLRGGGVNSSFVDYSILCQHWLCCWQGCSSLLLVLLASVAWALPQIRELQDITQHLFQLMLGN